MIGTCRSSTSSESLRTWWLTPTARVDQALLGQGAPNPAVGPQSFVVRSRTEVGLLATEDVDGAEANSVVGQLDWGAEPLQILVVEEALFADGFEDGTTSSWSSTVP